MAAEIYKETPFWNGLVLDEGCYGLRYQRLMTELLGPMVVNVGGTWLQLMCCALLKCLCPEFTSGCKGARLPVR